ncbi:hypothetical protein D3C78_1908220 [compost metagenome]
MPIAVENVVIADPALWHIDHGRRRAANGDDALHGHAVFDLLDQRFLAVGNEVDGVLRLA